jgi:hypothetical protein
MALTLNVTPTTTARWETTHPPRGRALLQIANLAESRGALVWADVFRKAWAQQKNESRYQATTQPTDEPHLDLADAFRNVARAIWQVGDDQRLMSHWARILEALAPAHGLVIRRAIRYNADVEEAFARGVFSPSEAEGIKESIEGLRDLQRRLMEYRKQAGEELLAMKAKKRKTAK